MSSLLYEQDGPYGIITLNRPDLLNAISIELGEELTELLDTLEGELEPRVLIITGSERAFCAGADLKSVHARAKGNNPALASKRFLDGINQLFTRMETYPKPIVAAMSGIAYGGGCELALACDVRVVADNSRIALSEVRLGVLPAAGGTQRLPRVIGLSRAKHMMLSGDPIDGQTALDWGFAQAIAPAADVLQAAKELSAPYLKGAPVSQTALKACALAAFDSDTASGLKIERQWANFLHTTTDSKEGVAAFNEKRKPNFQGK
ncbi:MAG: enoyl-CoA hydratase/isomerase family protein [Gammaproteobacteria bacterium]|nr:enoyl-CoA hydratase/isomerase family protein [Gammaproteobacteria bacterium]